tara:strand:+ start:184 stop:825 length:642 start_codon:yes stop_codon:yes gene_type:complete
MCNETAFNLFEAGGQALEAKAAYDQAKSFEKAQEKQTKLLTLSTNLQKSSIASQKRQLIDQNRQDEFKSERSAREQASQIKAAAGTGTSANTSNLLTSLGIQAGEDINIGRENLRGATGQLRRQDSAADINLSTGIANIKAAKRSRPSILGAALGVANAGMESKARTSRLEASIKGVGVGNAGETGGSSPNRFKTDVKSPSTWYDKTISNFFR